MKALTLAMLVSFVTLSAYARTEDYLISRIQKLERQLESCQQRVSSTSNTPTWVSVNCSCYEGQSGTSFIGQYSGTGRTRGEAEGQALESCRKNYFEQYKSNMVQVRCN